MPSLHNPTLTVAVILQLRHDMPSLHSPNSESHHYTLPTIVREYTMAWISIHYLYYTPSSPTQPTAPYLTSPILTPLTSPWSTPPHPTVSHFIPAHAKHYPITHHQVLAQDTTPHQPMSPHPSTMAGCGCTTHHFFQPPSAF